MPAIKPVSYQALVKVFEFDGFTFDRQKRDHLIYTKPVFAFRGLTDRKYLQDKQRVQCISTEARTLLGIQQRQSLACS